ncbi:hypothetical protein ScPMuIL_009449 [Solemya velum]
MRNCIPKKPRFNVTCLLLILLPVITVGIDEILLHTSSPEVCSHTFSYEPDAVYEIRAPGTIFGGSCDLTFTESAWASSSKEKTCYGLCINVTHFQSRCDVKMTYFDGIENTRPKEFNCHEFPPVLWCSAKNDIRVSFSELKSTSGERYDIIIRVKVVCRDSTPDEDINVNVNVKKGEHLKRTEIRKREVAIIVGSLVGTISFLFVIFWISYCCVKQKRQSQTNLTNTSNSASAPQSQPSTAPTYQSIPQNNSSPPKKTTNGETRVKEWYTMQDMVGQPPYTTRYSPPPYSTLNEPHMGHPGSRYPPYDQGPSPQSEYSFRPIAHGESPSKESNFPPDTDRPTHSIPPRNYDPTQLSRPYDRGPPYQQQPRVFNPPPYGAKQYLV